MRTVRLFVSSPGDVDFERQRVERVAERLNAEFAQVARFETVRWETKFYKAHETFQQQIPEAAECDIVVGIFWSRLGTALADGFPRLADGTAYPSGSAYEVLSAIEARKTAERPDVYVFRKTARPTSRIDQDDELGEARRQWRRLEEFFARWFHTPDGRFVGAYHTFETTDEFEAQVEKLLADWVHEHFLAGRQIVWPIELKGSPFRGLAPFDAKHAAIFFGRTRKVMRAVEHLKDAARRSFDAPEDADAPAAERRLKPFLLIVGPSGAGKSSLMRAGLAPRLTTPGVVPEVDLWRVAVMRPSDGAEPFDALAKALAVAGGEDDAGGFGRALPELAGEEADLPALLAQGGAAAAASVVAALDRVAAAERARGGFERALRTDLLLLVDQLEDVFAASVTEAERTRFAALLAALCDTKRIWLVATLRGDLYNRLIKNRAFIALKDAGHTYDLAPPGPDELAEIVQKSAEAAGLVYERNPATGERLDDRLLKDTEGKDILPLLEFTLDRLFEERAQAGEETRLTFASYAAMGGIDGAINQSAERALAGLGEAEVAALPRLLRSLAVPVREEGASAGAAELTVQAVPVDLVVADAATRRLVDALIGARIVLVSEADPAEEGAPREHEGGLLRIAHQRVFECWERARKIISDHRDFYRIRDAVEAQRRLWQNAGRRADLLVPDGRSLEEAQSLILRYGDELPRETRNFVALSDQRAQRTRTIKRAMQAALAVIAVVATGASLVAWHLGDRAAKNEREAVANYEAAKRTVDHLVNDIARGLRDIEGIRVATIDRVLTTVERTIGELQSAGRADPLLERSRAAMLYESARAYQAVKDQAKALRAAGASLAIRRVLVALPQAPRQWRMDLSYSLDQIGDLRRFADENAARAVYNEAFALREQLAREEPDNEEWHYGLSLSHVRLGDLDYYARRYAPAQVRYAAALRTAIDNLRRFPGSEGGRLKRELAWAYNKVGDVSMRLTGERPAERAALLETARDAFEKGLCVRRHIAFLAPDNFERQRDVSWSLIRVAEARLAAGERDAALDALYEALELRRRLSRGDPGNAQRHEDVSWTLHRIGEVVTSGGNPLLALAFFEAAADVRKRINLWAPDDRAITRALAESEQRAQAMREELRARGISSAVALDVLLERVADEEAKARRRLAARRPAGADAPDEAAACWNALVTTLGMPGLARAAAGP